MQFSVLLPSKAQYLLEDWAFLISDILPPNVYILYLLVRMDVLSSQRISRDSSQSCTIKL